MCGVARAITGGLFAGVLRYFLCSVFVGIAVKIMDDWLDGGYASATGAAECEDNFAGWLGAASLPYAMLSLVCGVLFAPGTAAGLVLSSYALGMVWFAGRDEYPSGLVGWQESALASAVALVGCGWRTAVVCGLCIAAVQGLDDAMDYRSLGAEFAPLVRRFGVVETVLGSCGLLLIALALDLSRSTGIALGAGIVWLLEGLLTRRLFGPWKWE